MCLLSVSVRLNVSLKWRAKTETFFCCYSVPFFFCSCCCFAMILYCARLISNRSKPVCHMHADIHSVHKLQNGSHIWRANQTKNPVAVCYLIFNQCAPHIHHLNVNLFHKHPSTQRQGRQRSGSEWARVRHDRNALPPHRCMCAGCLWI